ncbi:hypothetical protein EDD85DRAFT_795173 [Armillaria nabsnona]|nr:hypothetical protein EDD85DRAFT_795173 [Armillaria nabsnona]
MTAMTEVPDLSHADTQIIFKDVDALLNRIFLQAFCKGTYTGIIAITMWTVFSAKDTNRRLSNHMMVFVILCLYVLDTLSFAYDWTFCHWTFIDNGWNFWTVFLASNSFTPEYKRREWVVGVSGAINTLAADTSMIWRCWIVWGQHWLIILLPMLCLLTGTDNKVSGSDPLQSTPTNRTTSAWLGLHAVTMLPFPVILRTFRGVYNLPNVHRGSFMPLNRQPKHQKNMLNPEDKNHKDGRRKRGRKARKYPKKPVYQTRTDSEEEQYHYDYCGYYGGDYDLNTE